MVESMKTGMKMHKKAQAGFSFSDDWPETLAFVLLIAGFIVSLKATSAFLSYVVIVICGALFGRIWWRFRKNMSIPIILIALGFLIGYTLGAAFTYASAKVVFLLFILAVGVSYYIHEKKLIRTTDF
jgi:hypothetical protein